MSADHNAPVYEDTGLPQPYHLVRPSPWPLLAALAAGSLAAGIILYLARAKIGETAIGIKGILIGLAAVLAIMAVWWRDVLREAVIEKAHSPIVRIGLRYGVALFIASEVMFFLAFFWAYYDSALFPDAVIGGVWPPPGIKTFNPFDMPLTMTLILLLSGTTVTWAHHAALEGHQRDMARALGLTVGLGAVFTLFQAYEYHHAAFTMKDGIFGSTFYLATGFHGFHVLVGTIFLAVCWWRAAKGHFTPDSHFGLEAAAWYWHFVDVVWLLLFISVYWYGA